MEINLTKRTKVTTLSNKMGAKLTNLRQLEEVREIEQTNLLPPSQTEAHFVNKYHQMKINITKLSKVTTHNNCQL